MDNQNLTALLFENVYTKIEALKFIEKLQNISDSLFNVNISYDAVIDASLTNSEKQVFTKYAHQVGLNIQDPLALRNHLIALKELIDKQPILTLYLSVDPTPVMLRQISDWFIRSFNQKYFLDIQVKPELIGGAVIIVNGIYKDYSLQKYIEEKYHNQPNNSPSVTKNLA